MTTVAPGPSTAVSMASVNPGELTQLLANAADGSPVARERLLEAIYNELHGLAGGMMRGERADHTLQTTALIHEAFLRLFGPKPTSFESRAHFFGAAAEAMRRILVDHARQRAALKRGGGAEAVEPPAELSSQEDDPSDFLAVDEAVQALAASDARKAEIVKLRFYAGLGMDEIAAVLGVSPITVKRDWRFARAWLGRQLSGGSLAES